MIKFCEVSELAFETVIFECFEEPEKISFYSPLRTFLLHRLPDLYQISKTLYKDIKSDFPSYMKLEIRPYDDAVPSERRFNKNLKKDINDLKYYW